MKHGVKKARQQRENQGRKEGTRWSKDVKEKGNEARSEGSKKA